MNQLNRIQKAIDYIESNINSRLDNETIGRAAFMSASYIQHLFAVICGLTLGEYIRNRRLSMSKDDLLNTDASILDIALKYCYSTSEGYSRAFYRYYEITPSAVRRRKLDLKSFEKISMENILIGGNKMAGIQELTEKANIVKNMHPFYFTMDMEATVKWFEGILGWSSVVEARDENGNAIYGSTVPYPKELSGLAEYDFSSGLMFGRGEPIKRPYLFYNVRDINRIHSMIKENGWDEITELAEQPWGGITFTLTTIDGTGITFCG